MNQPIRITADGHTDPGNQRQENEDTFYTAPNDLSLEIAANRGYLYIVADGVGGHQGGDVASQMAVRIVQQQYYADTNRDLGASLEAAIQQANREIYHQGISSAGQYGMSTTLTAAVVRGNELLVANVGDSRTYLIHDGQPSQLTTDHTWVQERLQAGILSAQEAANHPQRNIITRSLGGGLEVQVDVFRRTIAPGDRLLLCSDGLSDLVNAQEMASVVGQGRTPKAAAVQLVELAKQRGAPDNVTVALVGVGEWRGAPVGRPFSIPPALLVLGGSIGAVALVAAIALLIGKAAVGRPPLAARTPRPSATVEATLPGSPTPLLEETPSELKLIGPEAVQEDQEVTLSWQWRELEEREHFVFTIWKTQKTLGPAVFTATVGAGEPQELTFVPQERDLPPGDYEWDVLAEENDEGKWEVRAEAQPRSLSVTPRPADTPTPPPTPTPEDVAKEIELLKPPEGETSKNPVTFEWESPLGPKQEYWVKAWLVGTNESQEYVMEHRTREQMWAVDLPAEKSGKWRWTVSVVRGEKVIETSNKWMFWFDPFADDNGDGDGDGDGDGGGNGDGESTQPAPTADPTSRP